MKTCVSLFLSVNLCMFLFVCLSVCLSVSLSVCLSFSVSCHKRHSWEFFFGANSVAVCLAEVRAHAVSIHPPIFSSIFELDTLRVPASLMFVKKQ